MHQVILEIICSIRRLERQSHRSTLAQRESSIELGLFDGSLGARVSGQHLSSMIPSKKLGWEVLFSPKGH